jgi:hypothetical protein
MNRDRKKSKKPFVLSDFYCYAIQDEVDSIDATPGAAAKKIIELGRFPNWALFVYKDLMKNADKGRAPNVLCYLSDNVIIIAPRITGTHCVGLVIALESASNRIVQLQTLDGDDAVRVRMPILTGQTVAIENCYLDIA